VWVTTNICLGKRRKPNLVKRAHKGRPEKRIYNWVVSEGMKFRPSKGELWGGGTKKLKGGGGGNS